MRKHKIQRCWSISKPVEKSHLRLGVEVALAEAVVLAAEADHACRLVHAARYVPDIEVLACVHDKELAQAVHEARLAGRQLLILPIVIHRAPVDLHDRELACVAPDGDGRGVLVVVDAKTRRG